MSITAGQAVTAANVNAAFVSKSADSNTTGRIGLLNTDTASIPELQAFCNHLISRIGLLAYNADTVFDDPDYLTNGMSVIEALDALDAQLKVVADSFAGIFSSNNEWTGTQSFFGQLNFGYENDTTTTGADQVLAVPNKIILRLQGNVTSIAGIENPSATRILVLINDTSQAVVLNDFDTVNASLGEYIRTGVNNDITMQDQSALLLVYDEEAELWQVVGGTGGGGGSSGGTALSFKAPAGDGALIDEEFDLPVFVFESGASQRISALVQVPDSFNTGFRPYIRIPSYCVGTDNHAYLVRTRLIKPTLQAVDSTVNSYTTSSTDFGLSGSNILEKRDVFLADANGQINGTDILAGDYLKIDIFRTSASGTEATEESKILFESIGVFFA